MPAKMYYDNDAPLDALRGQTVAVIGYGSQGHAHAQNLHDSEIDVVVGLAPGSKSRAHVEAAGIRVADVADAVRQADVVMIALPDTVQKQVYDAEIAPNLKPGALIMFAHGFNIRFGRIPPAAGIDGQSMNGLPSGSGRTGLPAIALINSSNKGGAYGSGSANAPSASTASADMIPSLAMLGGITPRILLHVARTAAYARADPSP